MRYRGSVMLVAVIVLAGCQGAAVSTPDERIFEAAWAEKGDVVRNMLKTHPDLRDQFSEDGYTLLNVALMTGQDDLAAHLLDIGAVPFRDRVDGLTPLHLAGSASLAKRLLDAGVSPRARDFRGQTPLHLARSVGVVVLLLAAGADPHSRDLQGNIPLVGVAHSGSAGVVDRLLAEGVDAESLDRALLSVGMQIFQAKKRLRVTGLNPVERRQFEERLAKDQAVAERLRAERKPGASSSLWQVAATPSPYRMREAALSPYEDYPLYTAVWVCDNERFLVCLEYPGGELGGTPYDVAVFNQNMEFVRGGDVTVPQDDEPYGLVERHSSAASLPDMLRGKWLLAIVTWHPETGFDERWPIVLGHQEGVGKQEVNTLTATRIDWWDHEVRPNGEQRIALERSVEVRWAEPGESPLLSPRPNQ